MSYMGWPYPTSPKYANKCDVSTCNGAAALTEVGPLRESSWPLKDKQLAPHIAHAVYINLDWDTARRDSMNKQLAAVAATSRSHGVNFTFERLSAVPAADVQKNASFEAFRARGFSTNSYPNMMDDWRTAAVQYSHESIIERIEQQGQQLLAKHEVWLILEDDAKVPPNLEMEWAKLWPYIPKEWDIMRVGWFGMENGCKACVNTKLHLAFWSDPPPHGPCSYCGTQGYIVNPATAKKVMQRLKTSKLYYIDALLGAATPPGEDRARVPDLAVFAPIPTIIKQDETFESDRV